MTPYQNAGNNPINDYDIDGMQSGNTSEGGDSKPAQDNTAVSNKRAELAAKNNIGDYKTGVKFKLTVDNTIKGASDEYNKKSFNQINVDNADTYNKVMQDDYFGPILREMVSSGLIQNGTDVNFKFVGNETSISTSGESLAFKYDLSWTNGNEKMKVPFTISAGQIVRFSGSHPVDYPLALLGSGAYSLLFKAAVVANAERELLKTAQPQIEEFISFFHKGELKGGVSSTRELSTSMDKSTVESLSRGTNKITEFRIPKSTFDKWQFEGSVRSFKDLDKVSGTYNFEWRFSPKVSEQMNNYMVK